MFSRDIRHGSTARCDTEGMGQSAGSFPFFCHFLKFTDYKSHAARRRYARMHGMTVCTYNFSHIRVYEKVSVAYRHTLHTCIHFQQIRPERFMIHVHEYFPRITNDS
jgi:hypothetical protein